jgi:hypothetical protein
MTPDFPHGLQPRVQKNGSHAVTDGTCNTSPFRPDHAAPRVGSAGAGMWLKTRRSSSGSVDGRNERSRAAAPEGRPRSQETR